jgi:hypothetical protein
MLRAQPPALASQRDMVAVMADHPVSSEKEAREDLDKLLVQ